MFMVLRRTQPFSDDIPARMISSTKSRLLAMTELKKKKETNYSVQTLYTVTIKQKEHINLRQKKKMPR